MQRQLAILIAAFACFASVATGAPFDYQRYQLYELVARADIAVTGEIVELTETHFELKVEDWVVGEGAGQIRVMRFTDWTCAGRWTDYAIGQRIFLFAGPHYKRGYEDNAYYIMGAGGEGELFLDGDDVIVRGYSVHGYKNERFSFESEYGHRTSSGARIPKAEWFAAVRGFREIYKWKEGKKTRGGPYAFGATHRISAEATSAFASTSKTATHLVEQVSTSKNWPRERTRIEPHMDTLPDIAAWRYEMSGRPRKEVDPPTLYDDPDGSTSFGAACAILGDLDGDGIDEYAIGAPEDSLHGKNHGALWILFPNADGSLRRRVEVGQLGAPAKIGIRFGAAVAALGDIDGDGIPDLAVSAYGDSTLAKYAGAVWILLLNSDGTTKTALNLLNSDAVQDHTAQEGVILERAQFGTKLTNLGDLDADGFPELLVSDSGRSSTLGRPAPTVLILSIGIGGKVRWVKSSERNSEMECLDVFNRTCTALGDVNGDGVPDVAFGAPFSNEGGTWRGGLWIVFLGADGSFIAEQFISDWSGGFNGLLRNGAEFGSSLISPGDVNGDGIPDLLVSSNECLWLLELTREGTVKNERAVLGLPFGASLGSFACKLAPRDNEGEGKRVRGTLLLGGFRRNHVRVANLEALLYP